MTQHSVTTTLRLQGRRKCRKIGLVARGRDRLCSVGDREVFEAFSGRSTCPKDVMIGRGRFLPENFDSGFRPSSIALTANAVVKPRLPTVNPVWPNLYKTPASQLPSAHCSVTSLRKSISFAIPNLAQASKRMARTMASPPAPTRSDIRSTSALRKRF